MVSQPFWSSVIRATRLSSATKKNSASQPSTNTFSTPPGASRRGSGESSVPVVRKDIPSGRDSSVSVARKDPPTGREKVTRVTSTSFSTLPSIPETTTGKPAPSVDQVATAEVESRAPSRHSLISSSEPDIKPCLHPAVSKLVAFELDGDLSCFKRTNSTKRVGEGDEMSTAGSSSDVLNHGSRRSSISSGANSRRGSIGSAGALSAMRRRVSFASSPSMVVSFDCREAPQHCLEKQFSCLDLGDSEIAAEGANCDRQDSVDLSVASSVIAPAADEQVMATLSASDLSKLEEEEARMAARVRAKQVKQLDAARKMSAEVQKLQEKQQRRKSWSRALSANALAMSGGMSSIVALGP
ncbi:hypothetical protein DFS34DRAFT_634399 [Phlyctochytrium arcticum]|nr:hypothetical protein DFS34DRAFT_634399 [Phlyctochytrium arcticum]